MKTENPNPLFHVVMYEPEIPNNTGNVGRSCVGLNSKLHLVGKLGFEINDKHLKRAGLDYWQHLDWVYHETHEKWMSEVPDRSRVFYIETTGEKLVYDVDFQPGDWFVFGRETIGLPQHLLEANKDRVLKLPMYGKTRSLNVANTVTIVMYEAVRQLIKKGLLSR